MVYIKRWMSADQWSR